MNHEIAIIFGLLSAFCYGLVAGRIWMRYDLRREMKLLKLYKELFAAEEAEQREQISLAKSNE